MSVRCLSLQETSKLIHLRTALPMAMAPSFVCSFPPSFSKSTSSSNTSWTLYFRTLSLMTATRCLTMTCAKRCRMHTIERSRLSTKRGRGWCREWSSLNGRSRCLWRNKRRAWGKHRHILVGLRRRCKRRSMRGRR